MGREISLIDHENVAAQRTRSTLSRNVAPAADINFSNQLSRFDPLGGDEYPAAFDPNDTTMGATVTTRYQDKTWQDIADAGTSGLFEVEWAINSNRLITFAFTKAKLAKKAMPITGPGRIEQSFDVTMEQTAVEAALVVTLKTGTASY